MNIQSTDNSMMRPEKRSVGNTNVKENFTLPIASVDEQSKI